MTAHQAVHLIATQCRVLGVSPSGYYAWRKRPLSARARADVECAAEIEAIHREPSAQAVDLVVSSHDQVLRYGQTGAFIDAFVPAGSGGLNGPSGLVFGPDGNLYVGSVFTNSVLRYDGTTGAFIDVFVPPGSGGLAFPTVLVFGPDGNLYVCPQDNDSVLRCCAGTPTNSTVLRYDGTTGAFIDAFVPPGSGGLVIPGGLVFGPDGNLYVVDSNPDNGQVLRYDGTTGAFIDAFVPPGSGGLFLPTDLAFTPLPIRKDQCMKGGWKAFGFKNQGQCIKFVNTDK